MPYPDGVRKPAVVGRTICQLTPSVDRPIAGWRVASPATPRKPPMNVVVPSLDAAPPGVKVSGNGAEGPNWLPAGTLGIGGRVVGGTVGYNATWTARLDTDVAIVNIGYADGYWRGFSDRGAAFVGDASLPVIGRVSMDLVAIDCSAADVAEGDWVSFDFALPQASAASGMSQYELLTGLGALGRYG